MPTLAINTASSTSNVALFTDGGEIKQVTWDAQNNEAEKLMPAIDQLTGGHFEQIDEVLVVNGPGSFTGLRIGVATANTIAYLREIPLRAINAFDLWWAALGDLNDHETALLIFAGKGGVYISLDGEVGTLHNLDEAVEYLNEHNISKIFGDISPEQKEHFEQFEFLEISANFEDVIKKIDRTELPEQKIVKPLYVKDPGITPSKKKLLD